MDLDGCFFEIGKIDTEIKRISESLKKLKTRKITLINDSIKIMNSRDLKEYNYNGRIYKLTIKPRKTRKKEAAKKKEFLEKLEERGIYGTEAEEMYNDALKSFTGQEQEIVILS